MKKDSPNGTLYEGNVVLGTAKSNLRRSASAPHSQAPLYREEEAKCIVSHNLLLLPHNTSGGGGPSHYDGAPFSSLERMFAYYFIIPRGHRKISPSVVIVTG